FVLHGPAKIASRRLRRRFKTITLNVVEPAMISAGDAPFLDSAIGKRCAAMGAVILQQTYLALGALEQHKVFTENPYKLCRILGGKILRDSDRMPVAGQQLSGRRAGPDPSQEFIFFGGNHLLPSLKHRRIDSPYSILNPRSVTAPSFLPDKNLIHQLGHCGNIPSI